MAMEVTITPARLVIAWDETGALKGGDLVRLVTVRDGERIVSRSEEPLVALAGNAQDGADLAPLLGQALADALLAAGAARVEADALREQVAAKSAEIAALRR
jgi:hypothetical protein